MSQRLVNGQSIGQQIPTIGVAWRGAFRQRWEGMGPERVKTAMAMSSPKRHGLERGAMPDLIVSNRKWQATGSPEYDSFHHPPVACVNR